MKVLFIALFAALAFVMVAAQTKIDGNNVGDIVTVDVNAQADISNNISQDIISIIIALINQQNAEIEWPQVPPQVPVQPLSVV